jgi:polysaccharide export outer membrane protein
MWEHWTMREEWTQILSGLSMALLLSCPEALAQQKPIVPVTGKAYAVATWSHSNEDQVVPTERHPRYRICRDDVLLLSFPLSPELNQKLIVQPDGFIMLQSAGGIYVEGLTVPGVVEAVKKAYASVLHNPIVDVDLADFQKPFFTVLGQVGKAGQYDLRYDITVTQAIAVAGGFAPTAKTQVFLYRAVSSNWAEVRELKIKDLLHGKNISEDVHLRPGDMIFVPEKFISNFKKYVPYSFNVSPPYPATF